VLNSEPDWRTLPPATPPGARRLLARTLTKDRKLRQSDAANARLDLIEAGQWVDGVVISCGCLRTIVRVM
jgi:hypothetical protein